MGSEQGCNSASKLQSDYNPMTSPYKYFAILSAKLIWTTVWNLKDARRELSIVIGE
jgi:hypothetical protein